MIKLVASDLDGTLLNSLQDLTNLSKFFADERFNEAEAQNWLKRNKEK